jgi:hypothetical protein
LVGAEERDDAPMGQTLDCRSELVLGVGLESDPPVDDLVRGALRDEYVLACR